MLCFISFSPHTPPLFLLLPKMSFFPCYGSLCFSSALSLSNCLIASFSLNLSDTSSHLLPYLSQEKMFF